MTDGNEEIHDLNNVNFKSICCEKIPDLFLDKLIAKNHFGKFGKINRFILRPNRQSCTVEYETEDEAQRAYMGAGDFNGFKFTITFAEREVGHVQNTEEWVNPEVQAELEAMCPGQRVGGAAMQMRQAVPGPSSVQNSKFLGTRPIKSAAMTGQMMPQKSILKPSVPQQEQQQQQQPQQQQLPKVDATLRNELESILRRPAYTDEEKFRILDARDKLIRLLSVRQTDITKAESTKGTCPDMCPEKERLMREFQRQVSSFEISQEHEGDLSTISHRRAIKEYSRSSADQEVPLSHELRPEGVLKMTMLYLMHRILDLCSDPQTSLGDWFHFVWDRTRSIRKDITQQELCSLGTVQLVEQCARFHIHCAARLVAEDPSVFDKKINAENLTKCLQSLKYMYHDLRIKNVLCPCEAEFRSYIVLLNLGDSNFLWELKQLPEHIQKSVEIKKAIAFYNALQNNNYVRFFGMVRSSKTSYLSACILLGYFNKLRVRAMEVINKSHNWRKNAVILPLKYLTRILGFEDEEAAARFFTYHGLRCSSDRVILDRLKKPEIEYTMNRALKLVESKLKTSVGECVCGHPLETAEIFENHQPHNSFDENGLLRPESWTAEDQLRGKSAEEMAARKQQQQQQQRKQQQPSMVTTTSAPTIRTDTNIFKIPQASPPISPKQQQNQMKPQQQTQQQQQQQQRNIFSSPSAFGGQTFGDVTKTPPMTQPTLGGFKFTSPSVFGSTPSSQSQSSSSTPNSGTGAGTKQTPFVSIAPSMGFCNSIFKQNPEVPSTGVGGNIFGISTANEGKSIFGTTAKETKGLFQQQQQLQQKQQQPEKQPAVMAGDNIFQHFKTEPQQFGDVSKSIFGKQNQQKSVEFDRSGDGMANQTPMQRLLELEEQHKRKEQEIAEERRKLQLLEEEKKKQQQQKREKERLKAIEAEKKRKELEQQLLEKAEHEANHEIERFVSEEVAEIAKNELELYKKFETRCSDLLTELLVEFVTDEVREIACTCYDQLLLARYFERWLQHTRKKQKQRFLMESSPIWITTETRAEQTRKLLPPKQEENLQMIKRYRHGEPCDFKALLWKHPDAHRPKPLIDMCQVIAKQAVRKDVAYGGHLHTRKYFKLLLSLPGERDELPGYESLCHKWLQTYLKRPEHLAEDSEAYICGMEHDVALCVRKANGIVPLNEKGDVLRHEGLNSDGIIFFMSSPTSQVQKAYERTQRRLNNLLELCKIQKSIPVAFVVYNSLQDELELVEQLGVEDEQLISAYRFCGCGENKDEFFVSHNIAKALRFVARESSFCNAESAESLEMQSLSSWLESNLGEEMWQRWHDSSLNNPPFSKICSMPQHVIGLYNRAIKLLEDMAAEDFHDAPEFPSELRKFVPKVEGDVPLGLEHFPTDWKSSWRQREILNFLERIKLPALDKDLPQELKEWELLLLNYASISVPHDEQMSTQTAYLAIKALIEQLNREDLQDFDLPDRLDMISYLPVIKAIVFARASSISKSSHSRKLPAEIVYRRQALLSYREQPWWLNYKAVEAVTVDYTQCDGQSSGLLNAASSSAIEENSNEDEDFEKILQRAEEVARQADEHLDAITKTSPNVANSEVQRDMDTSLYQFEVAKQIGQFTLAYTDELDAEIEKFTSRSPDNLKSVSRKRKHVRDVSEMEAIMTQAFDVINRLESKEDHCRRLDIQTKLVLDDC